MVDLPIPQPELVTTQTPNPGVTAGDIARSGGYVAQGVDRLGQGLQIKARGEEELGEGLENLAMPFAQQAGEDAARKAVQIGPDGQPTVVSPAGSFIMGKAGDAYAHAALVGTAAESQTQMEEYLANLHQKYPYDAEAFKAGAQTFVNGRAASFNGGPIAALVQQEGDRLVAGHYGNIVDATAARGFQTARDDIVAQLNAEKDTALALARKGGSGTPELAQAQSKIQGLYDNLSANPRFGLSKDQADLEVRQFGGLLQGEAIVAHVDDTFTKKGKAQAQQELDTGVLNNPDLKVSETDRTRLYNQGLQRLAFLTNDAKAGIDASKQITASIEEDLRTGKMRAEDPTVSMAIQRASDFKDSESVQRLQAAAQVQLHSRGLMALPDAQQAQILGVPFAGSQPNAAGPAPGANGMGMINAPYTAPFDQPGEKGIVSPSQVYQHLISAGATKNEALLLTSAAGSESSFNPTAVHDNGNGYGLFGHNLQRLDLRGKDWQQQSEAALAELRSRPEGASVNAATTPEQLAVAEMHFEQPRGYTQSNPTGGDNYTGRLNTIRNFANQVGGGAPASGVAPVVFGDSLGAGLRQAAGVGTPLAGDTLVGRTPGQVLKAINAADPQTLAGKPVILSSGSSNDVAHVSVTTDQINALKAKGVDPANITVLGVGDRQDFQQANVNGQLQAIAKAAGAKFAPIDPSSLSADRVHPATYAGLLASVGGGAPGAAPSPSADATGPINGRPGFTYADVRNNGFLLSAYAHQVAADGEGRIQAAIKLGESLDGAFKSGVIPRAQDVAQVIQAGEDYPDRVGPIAQKMKGYLAGDAINAVLPASQAAAYVDNVMSQAQGQDIHTINTAIALKEQFERGVRAFNDHPMMEAINRGWIKPTDVPPFDPQNPNAIPTVIAQRSAAAAVIGSHSGNPDQSILDKDEVPQVKAWLSASPVAQQLSLLTPMSALPDSIRAATFKQLGDDKEGKIFSVAGNLAAIGQTPAARDVLTGNALLKQDKDLAPKAEDLATNSFKSLPTTSFPDSGLRASVVSAAEALYAKQAADLGGPRQTFDEDLWDKAVNTVTGGVVDYRGSKIIVPQYGMDEGGLKQVLSSLTDADLAASRLSNGQPLPAAQLQPSMFSGSQGFRLESHGDGQYLVFSGADNARRYVEEAAPIGSEGRPFVLDLSRKVPGAAPAAPVAPPGGWGPLGPRSAPPPSNANVGALPAPDLSSLAPGAL